LFQFQVGFDRSTTPENSGRSSSEEARSFPDPIKREDLQVNQGNAETTAPALPTRKTKN
jgi:hypothetical protein